MTVGDDGVMAIEINSGAVTVNVALLEVIPVVEAVTVVLPSAREDASPLPFIVATAVFEDDQMTDPERLAELVSE